MFVRLSGGQDVTHWKSSFNSYDNISCHLVCLYVLLVRFDLEEAKTMKQTSRGFKEKCFILQPLSKPNLEIKSKTNRSRNCQFL